MRARRSLAGVAARCSLVGLLAPAPAAAAGPRVEWRAPSGCPSASELHARVERLLGRSLAAVDVDLVVDARVVGREEGWFATLDLRAGASGRRRELRARGCEELADAVALLVAIVLDPSAAPVEPDAAEPEVAAEDAIAGEAPRPAAEVAPAGAAPPPTPAEPDPVAPSSTPTDRRRRDLRGSLGAAYTSAVGPVPGYAPGVRLLAGLTHRRLRVEAQGAYFGRRPLTIAATGVRASFDLWWVAARGCGLVGADAVELALCGGLELGRLRGEASGVEGGVRAALPWVAVDAGATVHLFPTRMIALGLGIDLAVPVVRPIFTIDNLGEIHRAAPVAGVFHLGVEVRIPRLHRGQGGKSLAH